MIPYADFTADKVKQGELAPADIPQMLETQRRAALDALKASNAEVIIYCTIHRDAGHIKLITIEAHETDAAQIDFLNRLYPGNTVYYVTRADL